MPSYSRPVYCVLNPQAGNGRAAALQVPLQAALAAQAQRVELLLPTSVPEARAAIASLPRGARVLVAGGDGTVQQLLPALLACEAELALLPVGSGNDLARALGVRGMHWQAALGHALQGSATRMDVGQVTLADAAQPALHFLSSLCCGFDAQTAAQLERVPKWLPSNVRYSLSALRQMRRYRRYAVQWQIDTAPAQQASALLASVLNTRTYGSGMPLAPAAQIADGQLDFVLGSHFSRFGALAIMPLMLLGWHTWHPWVQVRRFTQLTLSSPQPLPLALDGEPIAAACRVQVRVLPAALAVVRAQSPIA